MTTSYDQLLIEWAHSYNGYERLAGNGPRHLYELTLPLQRAFDRNGNIPEWAGVDLLRGWTFYLARAHRHGGAYDDFAVEYPQILAIVDAVNRHEGAKDDDRAPSRRENQ
ncbi:hypothetical protein C5O27_15380 [Gordonia alkanivorans]|uniref:hypothetical protein n=1 Tax=Gordonia alkanivorans TaxID=84096 RepID=UPI000FDD6F72|nr:hypothetical protein [Gordonia alkanivorans]AZZ82281.1 hypothetical protein C5O27_15380 [Gordonia alkanivorans]